MRKVGHRAAPRLGEEVKGTVAHVACRAYSHMMERGADYQSAMTDASGKMRATPSTKNASCR